MKNRANRLFIYFALCALLTPKNLVSKPAIISPELYARGAALYARGVELCSRGPQTFTNVCREMANRKDSVFLAGIALTAGALMMRYYRIECQRADAEDKRREEETASLKHQLTTQNNQINLLNNKLMDIQNKVTHISSNQIPELKGLVTQENQKLEKVINANHEMALGKFDGLLTRFNRFHNELDEIKKKQDEFGQHMNTMDGKLDAIGQDTRKLVKFVEQFQPRQKSIFYNESNMVMRSGWFADKFSDVD